MSATAGTARSPDAASAIAPLSVLSGSNWPPRAARASSTVGIGKEIWVIAVLRGSCCERRVHRESSVWFAWAVSHTPGSAVPGAGNSREQQRCRMGFPGAHNVRRRPQTADRRDWEWRGMSADTESGFGRLQGRTERRARTTAVATLAAAQNGTSGVLAISKHALG